MADHNAYVVEENENDPRNEEEDENDTDVNEGEPVFSTNNDIVTSDEEDLREAPSWGPSPPPPESFQDDHRFLYQSPEGAGSFYDFALRRPDLRPSTAPIREKTTTDENKPVVQLPPPVQLPSKTRLKIQIKALHPVAEWKWVEGGDDSCGICQMPFEVCCVACRAPGDDCPLVAGVCRHSFHLHCITKWTSAQTTPRPQCPMCRQEWRTQSIRGN